MRNRYRLPTFGSGKNPFASAPTTETPEPAVEPRIEPSAADLEAARIERAPVADKPGLFTLALSWLGSHAKRFHPRRWNISRAPKSSASPTPPFRMRSPFSRPAAARAQVQGELSLDQVRVIRNELSDPDVEIVRARPPARAESRQAEPLEAGELAGIRSL
jgi:hypothetical protein